MNLFDMLPPSGQPKSSVSAGRTAVEDQRCSRKGCKAAADWQLLWNNPKIHTPERRKIWLACQDHRAWLEDYLQTRGLWKETIPVTPQESKA
ncbi:hypothetical protein ACQR35_10410 [Pseudarthrobacter sp. J1738]|uniref:hypothetical protein n=1 Tax=unclassified Pseudarthrobacter TaxID=2647000 RepID=UPI003D2B4072